jgi:hypothetical protein
MKEAMEKYEQKAKIALEAIRKVEESMKKNRGRKYAIGTSIGRYRPSREAQHQCN